MTLPVPKIEIAFTTGPNDPSPAYVDVTQWVKALDGMTLIHGRQDQFQTTQPATLTLTLLNSDGRFTPGNIGSPYYPNVKKGRKVRVSVTDNGVTYRRFTGFVDEWPVVWADASTKVASVTIAATSRMARLGKSATLASLIQVEYELDGPVADFPLGEQSGSLNAGNVSTSTQPQMAITAFGGGTTGNITFGNALTQGTGNIVAAQFTRVSSSAGAYLLMTSPTIIFTPLSFAVSSTLIEGFFLSSSTQEMGILQADQYNTFPAVNYLGTNASGKLIGVNWNTGNPVYTVTSPGVVTDGNLHHVAFRETYDGTNTIGDLFLDGTKVTTNTLAGDWRAAFQRLVGGGGIVNSAFVGSLAHVSLTVGATAVPDARIQQHALAGLTGFSGEASGARIQRLANYGSVPVGDLVIETGLSMSLLGQDTTGQIPLALMQDVTATEGGVLFDGTDGTFNFQSRSHRYNQSSVLTLNGSNGKDLWPTFTPKLDDQALVNDITASRAGGVSQRAVDTNSITDYGLYHQDLTLLTTSDNEVADAANWKVTLGSTPQVAVSVAEIELAGASTALKATILAREISDRITLSNLPSQAPAASMDFNIEGWTETITGQSHRIAFNLSNALSSGVWQLDSSTYSVLNTSTRLAY